jgi:hypothetical protein
MNFSGTGQSKVWESQLRERGAEIEGSAMNLGSELSVDTIAGEKS